MFIFLIFVVLFVAFLYWKFNKAKIKGKWGEQKVSVVLACLSKEYRVYNNIILKNGNTSSQIDHVVVSPYGIFVIETKNYKGWITGGENSQYWTQNIWGNKYKFFNPVLQNRAHINALRKLLAVNDNNALIPIVVFTGKAWLKVIVPDHENVIYASYLYSTIKSYKTPVLSELQLESYCRFLATLNVSDKVDAKSHITNAKISKQRTMMKIDSGICPRCGAQLVERSGKYGNFLGCSNYPKCRFTENL